MTPHCSGALPVGLPPAPPSSRLQGPFNFSDVALPVWQHNPQVIRHPDGTYLLFTIGMDPEGKVATCNAAGGALADAAHGAELIELHYSASPYGPWTELLVPGAPYNGRNLFSGTNPTPWILPNGSVIGGWGGRAGGRVGGCNGRVCVWGVAASARRP